jgi:hypothetical protein
MPQYNFFMVFLSYLYCNLKFLSYFYRDDLLRDLRISNQKNVMQRHFLLSSTSYPHLQ